MPFFLTSSFGSLKLLLFFGSLLCLSLLFFNFLFPLSFLYFLDCICYFWSFKDLMITWLIIIIIFCYLLIEHESQLENTLAFAKLTLHFIEQILFMWFSHIPKKVMEAYIWEYLPITLWEPYELLKYGCQFLLSIFILHQQFLLENDVLIWVPKCHLFFTFSEWNIILIHESRW